jgi:hypothetical protein
MSFGCSPMKRDASSAPRAKNIHLINDELID